AGSENENEHAAAPAVGAAAGAASSSSLDPLGGLVVPAARPAGPHTSLPLGLQQSTSALAAAAPTPTPAPAAGSAAISSAAPAPAQPDGTKEKPSEAPLIVSEECLQYLAHVLCLGSECSDRAADSVQQIIRALAAHHPTNQARLARQLVRLGIE